MRKVLAMLCCAVLSAAATDHFLHRHRLLRGKHYHPPAIAVSRTMDTLIITSLQGRRPLPKAALRLAAHSLERQGWNTPFLAAPPAAVVPWPGLAGQALDGRSAVRRAPGAGGLLPGLNKEGPNALTPTIDIGDSETYAQLSLNRPCETIAHCNWLGVRAIREGAPRKAIRPFRSALQLAVQQHDQYMTLIGYHNLAMAYWWSKHYRQAAEWAEKGRGNTPAAALASGQDASVAQD